MKKLSRIVALFAALALVFCCAAASAETNFPNGKTITIIVPFKAGGNVDLTTRIVADALGKVLDTNVVVECKEGGGAIIGQTYALNQAPDGYTILALTSSFVTNVLSGDTEYGMEDAVAIGQVCSDPEVIVASADSGFTTLAELMKAGQEGILTNSTPGFSTSHHIASLIFAQQFGVNFEYVHTNGSSEQVVQLAGGHVQMGFTTYGGAATLIADGKIVPLAVCANERTAALPDVPTVEEAGFEPFVYGAYRGYAVPKGTPDEVVTILSDALKEVMEDPDVQAAFDNAGFPVAYLNAADFQAMLDQDYVNMESIYHLLEE